MLSHKCCVTHLIFLLVSLQGIISGITAIVLSKNKKVKTLVNTPLCHSLASVRTCLV